MAELTLTTSGTQLTLTASGESLTFETAGELNAAANVGGAAEVFRDKTGAILNFRTLSGTGGIVVAVNGDVVEIDGSGIPTGESNTGANIGASGSEVFRDKTGVTLNFRKLVGIGAVTVTTVVDTITNAAAGATGTATFIPFFDSLGDLADSPLFVDDATTPTELIVPLDLTVSDGILTVAKNAAIHRIANITFLNNVMEVIGGGTLDMGNASPWLAESDEADSATAIAFKFNKIFGALADPDAKLFSLQNADVEKFNISKDGDVVLVAIDAADNAIVDSPVLTFRGNHDSDPTAGITPTAFDIDIQNIMLTGGASPTAKLSFQFNGFEEFNIQRTATSAVFSRTGFSNAFLQLEDNLCRIQYGGDGWAVDNTGAMTAKSGGVSFVRYAINPTMNTIWNSAATDTMTAVGFTHKTTILDKDTFTAGALHTEWIDAGDDTLLSLLPSGLLDYTTTDALGGGAVPTLGTIGGTGPATAAQSKWLKIKINGTDHWLPAWV